MSESVQHKLTRVRPPRVKITYDVEIGNAIQKKELPFVGAMIADLAGKNISELPRFKDRKFVEIDRDNLNDIMKSIRPRVAYKVPNRLSNGEGEVSVDLAFESMEDFEPAQVIQQVEPLRKLYEARQRLNDLAAKLDGNDQLDQLLADIVSNTDQQSQLRSELEEQGGAADAGESGGGDSDAGGSSDGNEGDETS